LSHLFFLTFLKPTFFFFTFSDLDTPGIAGDILIMFGFAFSCSFQFDGIFGLGNKGPFPLGKFGVAFITFLISFV